MSQDLPLDLLRSLVAAAEGGSLAAASLRVGRTASAVSLQMTKLEAAAGCALFERVGRRVTLNAQGRLLLDHAREILARHDAALRALRGGEGATPVRIGLVQDYAASLLQPLGAELRAAYPRAQLTVRIDGSRALRAAVAAGELDWALTAIDDAATRPLAVVPMVWLGRRDVVWDAPLPLALVTPPCPFAAAATQALDAAGRAYRVSLTSPSLDGATAAWRMGLGIGCRTPLLVGDGVGLVGAALDLPPLPEIGYGLILGRDLSPAARWAAEATADLARR